MHASLPPALRTLDEGSAQRFGNDYDLPALPASSEASNTRAPVQAVGYSETGSSLTIKTLRTVVLYITTPPP